MSNEKFPLIKKGLCRLVCLNEGDGHGSTKNIYHIGEFIFCIFAYMEENMTTYENAPG